MTSPIERICIYCYQIQPHAWKVKCISILPIVNNIFFQIKSKQLASTNQKALQDFAWVLKCGLCAQIIIYGKPLAMILQRLSFKNRMGIIFSITLYGMFSHMHIKALTPD